MNINKECNAIIVNEDDFKVVIASDGEMKELWYTGNLNGLKKVFGKNNFESESNFAEKLVDEIQLNKTGGNTNGKLKG